jgi:lysylphosphatidylglycerol synthetase-like protein (DUF2156 family)
VEVTRKHVVRSRAALSIALAGLLDLISAVSPPLLGRLRWLLQVVPMSVPEAAAAFVALVGLCLLLLARGVRRGGHRPWVVTIGLLAASAFLHVAKGIDVEEATVDLIVLGYLFHHRAAFRARSDDEGVRSGLLLLGAGLVTAVVVALIAVEVRPDTMPIGQGLLAVLERLVGLTVTPLPTRLEPFLDPVLATVGFAIVGLAVWLAFRPVVLRRLAPDPSRRLRARAVVDHDGGDTLAYFALRDDKQWFFWGESVVAYAVFGAVCLVSPDPIGPVGERTEVWAAFRRFADEQGWALAVMGGCESWLPTYRDSGMREMYIGDEAVVDCQTFSLDGGRFKGLRQAVNRVAKYGYRAEFHDPATLPRALEADLRRLVASSRQGAAERGFSMTLGRLFDAEDTGLMLTVVLGPDGQPVAFCQFVPAPDIFGYSLDVMRRDKGEHPNGLLDFAIVETMRHLRTLGFRGLALNFATMRAVIAGENDDELTARAQKWLFQRLSGSMQIESLWRYNAKFDPVWRPRYALYDARANFLDAAVAVARAESFWELPVIGRFFVPGHAA